MLVDHIVNKRDLISISSKSWRSTSIRSVAYEDEGGFHFNQIIERMDDEGLAKLPSPFLDGTFDELLRQYPGQKWILMYETDRGCPYQCSYCDWGGAVEDKVQKFPLEKVSKEIEWIGKNKIPYVFLCNANFGILQRDVDIAEMFASTKRVHGYPHVVSTQNAKNPKVHTIKALNVLDGAGLNKAAVLSQQSINPATLKAVRRDNMKLEEYSELQRSLKRSGVYTMTDLIFPMPHETLSTFQNAIDTLIGSGAANKIQFNNLSILVNTEMGDPEYQRLHDFDIVKLPIINVHGSLGVAHGIEKEYQELVVGTTSMPRPDWKVARVLAWLVNLLYFNKLYYAPLRYCSSVSSKGISELIQDLVLHDESVGPVWISAVEQLRSDAEKIADGSGNEFIYSMDYLGIYWPPEEYQLIRLVMAGDVMALHNEVNDYLERECNLTKTEGRILRELSYLNLCALKVPNGRMNSIPKPILSADSVNFLKSEATLYSDFKVSNPDRPIDFDSQEFDSPEHWMRHVVWYGSRRADYLWGVARD